MGRIAVVVGPLLVGIYTFNYARWAWRQGLRTGGVGLTLVAVVTVVLPLLVLWLNS